MQDARASMGMVICPYNELVSFAFGAAHRLTFTFWECSADTPAHNKFRRLPIKRDGIAQTDKTRSVKCRPRESTIRKRRQQRQKQPIRSGNPTMSRFSPRRGSGTKNLDKEVMHSIQFPVGSKNLQILVATVYKNRACTSSSGQFVYSSQRTNRAKQKAQIHHTTSPLPRHSTGSCDKGVCTRSVPDINARRGDGTRCRIKRLLKTVVSAIFLGHVHGSVHGTVRGKEMPHGDAAKRHPGRHSLVTRRTDEDGCMDREKTSGKHFAAAASQETTSHDGSYGTACVDCQQVALHDL